MDARQGIIPFIRGLNLIPNHQAEPPSKFEMPYLLRFHVFVDVSYRLGVLLRAEQ